MLQIVLLSLITPTFVTILCVTFYFGYKYGCKQTNKKVELTEEQLKMKKKRERLEDQFDRIFSYSIAKAREKRS